MKLDIKNIIGESKIRAISRTSFRKTDIKKMESMIANADKLPEKKQSKIRILSFWVFKQYAKGKLKKAKKEKNETDIKFFNTFLDALDKKNEDVIETCLMQQGLIKRK